MAHESEFRSLEGTMPVRFRYTPGAAGARFFETLKQKGMLAATRCAEDSITYLPPRLYCEDCFADLAGTWTEVPPRGRVHTFTVLHLDREGHRLERPEIAAFVRIDGTDGGLVTRLVGVDAGAVRFGQEVEAVLRPQRERTGTLEDIVGFAPTGTAAQFRQARPTNVGAGAAPTKAPRGRVGYRRTVKDAPGKAASGTTASRKAASRKAARSRPSSPARPRRTRAR